MRLEHRWWQTQGNSWETPFERIDNSGFFSEIKRYFLFKTGRIAVSSTPFPFSSCLTVSSFCLWEFLRVAHHDVVISKAAYLGPDNCSNMERQWAEENSALPGWVGRVKSRIYCRVEGVGCDLPSPPLHFLRAAQWRGLRLFMACNCWDELEVSDYWGQVPNGLRPYTWFSRTGTELGPSLGYCAPTALAGDLWALTWNCWG